MNTKDAEFLKDVAEREEKATKGPWVSSYEKDIDGFEIQATKENAEWPLIASVFSDNGNDVAKKNATFISYSRSDIPRLLSIIEELQKELSKKDKALEVAEKMAEALEQVRKQSKYVIDHPGDKIGRMYHGDIFICTDKALSEWEKVKGELK